MFPTPKLKALQCHKMQLKRPLVVAINPPNFIQFCWTVMEKKHFVHTNVLVTTFTMCMHLSASESFRTHNSSLEGAMELKFVSFCSP